MILELIKIVSATVIGTITAIYYHIRYPVRTDFGDEGDPGTLSTKRLPISYWISEKSALARLHTSLTKSKKELAVIGDNYKCLSNHDLELYIFQTRPFVGLYNLEKEKVRSTLSLYKFPTQRINYDGQSYETNEAIEDLNKRIKEVENTIDEKELKLSIRRYRHNIKIMLISGLISGITTFLLFYRQNSFRRKD